MKIFFGIDPGKLGGIAIINERGEAWAHKMPETCADLSELIISETADNEAFAIMERVHSMPNQGVASCFTFGQGYGQLEMALVCCGVPHEKITPQKWQKALGCMTGGDKNVSKRKAQELFPKIKCTHSISDALLIAHYAKNHHNKP